MYICRILMLCCSVVPHTYALQTLRMNPTSQLLTYHLKIQTSHAIHYTSWIRHYTHYTLHIAHYILHITHHTVHLNRTPYTWHLAHYTITPLCHYILYTLHLHITPLHITQYTITHYTLQSITPNTEHWTLNTILNTESDTPNTTNTPAGLIEHAKYNA